MAQRTYEVTLTGKTGLIMHPDNIEWSDYMAEWQKDPSNKAISKKGDDRSPAWRWIGSVQHDGRHVGLPSDNLMTMLREGGARVPTGKGSKTYKSQTQSGLIVTDLFWPISVNGSPVAWDDIKPLREEEDFMKHLDRVRELGFDLLVKRARIGQSKHVRVRPMFTNWSATGRVAVFDEQITTKILDSILFEAGRYVGLMDWRPSSKTPGPWGTFVATIKEV